MGNNKQGWDSNMTEDQPKTNSGNFANDPQNAREEGQKGGKASQQGDNAHTLTSDEKSRGGQNSSGQFEQGSDQASEAGRKGGSM